MTLTCQNDTTVWVSKYWYMRTCVITGVFSTGMNDKCLFSASIPCSGFIVDFIVIQDGFAAPEDAEDVPPPPEEEEY